MKIQCRNRAGFTLIELIATLVLSGIVLVFAGMLMETSTNIFINGKEAAEDSQKVQIAMNRLVKELTYAGADTLVISDNGQTIQWISRHPDRLNIAGSATWNGTVGSDLDFITSGFQGSALLDNVSLFTVSSAADAVTITMKTRDSNRIAHTTTFHPRYEQ
ncbi:prepilin-type N-terminal cleavage/methylation domain-containing protein [bacterium]|nr:prepilin-type N-terminal cleavage/methylation domain-containing protein [bacterium]